MSSKYKRCSRWRFYLSTAVTLSLPVHHANAQTISAHTESAGKFTAASFQEITVTATRTSRKISDVPESVSIVDTEEIRTRQASDIGDLLRYLPNIELGGGAA